MLVLKYSKSVSSIDNMSRTAAEYLNVVVDHDERNPVEVFDFKIPGAELKLRRLTTMRLMEQPH